MADYNKIMKVTKFAKNGLKLLLDNVLEVLSPDMTTLIPKSWRKLPIDVATFSTFFSKNQFYLVNNLRLLS